MWDGVYNLYWSSHHGLSLKRSHVDALLQFFIFLSITHNKGQISPEAKLKFYGSGMRYRKQNTPKDIPEPMGL